MVLDTPKQAIVGRHVFRPFPASFRHIRGFHSTDNGSDYTANKFIQYFEEIIKRTIEAFSPQILATLNAYEDVLRSALDSQGVGLALRECV